MIDRVSGVLDGALGYFAEVDSDRFSTLQESDLRPGYIGQRDDGLLGIELTEDDPFGPRSRRSPTRAVLGATSLGGVVMLDCHRRTDQLRTGLGQISTGIIYGDVLLAGVSATELTSILATEATVRFHGSALLGWAGLDFVEQEILSDPETGLTREASIHLQPVHDQTVRLRPGEVLTLSGHWQVNPDSGIGQIVTTSMALTVRTSRPSPIVHLLQPIFHLQMLLSLAFRGFVAADSGNAALGGLDRERPQLWARPMMEKAAGVPASTASSFPLFFLDHLGGITGLKRWVNLVKAHPRAVAPILNRYRIGRPDAAVQLLEVAAAIEFWVASHRRTTQWAHVGDNPAAAVGLHVGKPFDRWSAGARTWAEAFWSHYNGLKHDPSFDPDRRKVAILAENGFRLLAAALLDRVSRSKQPSRTFFEEPGRLSQFGQELRTVLS